MSAAIREALEPFAKIAEHDIGTDETDADFFRPMDRHNRMPRLTVGDLRRARTAYDAIGSGVKALPRSDGEGGWTLTEEVRLGLQKVAARWQTSVSLEAVEAIALEAERRIIFAGDTVAWRDMASAPKDGSRFLAKEGDRHFDCWWFIQYDEAYWMDQADSEPDPTHWMPLPGEARPAEEPGEVERHSDEESYQIGKRDGYEDAVQRIDERTGGDGEYVAVVGYDGDDRNCPDAPSMVAKIVRRFEAVEHRAEIAEAALAETRAALQYARNLLGPDEIIDAALTGDAQEAGR